jgi:phosphate transport system substrate-binding protein
MILQVRDRRDAGHPRSLCARACRGAPLPGARSGSVLAEPARWNAPRRAPALLATLLFIGLLGCRSQLGPTYELRLAGAQIPLELIESWLKTSRATVFHVKRVQPVYLSQHGFERLRAGECDIACTDRTIADSERADFGATQLYARRLAFYGYALYVHPENPLDSIFSKHIGLLFDTKIRDWKELGGREGPIRLYGPAKSTRGGELLMFQTRQWFAKPNWEICDTDAKVVERVAADPGAVGFATIGLDNPTRYLGIRMERQGPPAFPSLEEIESERYGLAKVIYLYARAPLSPAVQAAADYLKSDAGQRAIAATDVWPVAAERAELSP